MASAHSGTPSTPRPLSHKTSTTSLFKLGSARKPAFFGGHQTETNATEKPAGSLKQLFRTVSSASARSAESAFGVHKSKHDDDEREPFKSFLRIRPPPTERPNAPSFVEVIDEQEVKLHAPDNALANGILGMRATPGALPTSNFAFTRIFAQQSGQADFFRATTLPLVQELLDGMSGLLFAYGVSNSGKTYTVQGGPHTGEPGILPRAVDVIFNSIAGRQSQAHVRPAKMSGVESIPPYERTTPKITMLHSTDITAETEARASIDPANRDDTVLPVAEGFQYAVWVSYVEVYNEKVYDLLEQPSQPSPSCASANTSFSSMSLATLATNNVSTDTLTKTPHSKGSSQELKRKALSLKHDKAGGSKYVSGATEVRVWSAEDARTVMRKGQINRRVFGTLLNRTSSRSHGIFTVKVVRVPVASPSAPSSVEHAASARLCIVDLAGSERTRHTQTTGERLKEAGNINKSLMVLGQCLEVIRQNQKREKGRKPMQVPFRHSKLTELFQSFFQGHGRAAMIVCLNPYDTGYEESMHVMKFSAVAKDVTTAKSVIPEPSPVLQAPPTPHRLVSPPPSATKHAIHYAVANLPATPKRAPLQPARSTRENTPRAATPRASTPAPADEVFELAPEHMSEGESTEADEEEEDGDPGVDYLFEEIAELRVRLVEAEIEAAALEARVRQEVVREFSKQMRQMEDLFNERMQEAVDAAERKADLKINILQNAHNKLQAALRRPAPSAPADESEEEEEDDEADDEVEEQDDTEDEEDVEVDDEVGNSSADRLSASTKSDDFETAQNSVEEPVVHPVASTSQQPQLVIDVDAEASATSDAETVPSTRTSVVAPTSTAIPVDPPTPLRKPARKSTRKSAAAPAATATTTPRALPRKSRARPGAVAARVKAFEQVLSADEGESVILEVGKSPASKKKRKLAPKAATSRDLTTLLDEDDDGMPIGKTRTRASAGAALMSKSSSSRTIKAVR